VTVGLEWLPQTAFAYLMIFARVGTLLMLMPALGERAIPGRLRLSFALLFSLMIYPLVGGELPDFTDNLYQALALMGHEIAVGFILGGLDATSSCPFLAK
jgi:flagellar biosynthetic protein FliR